MKIWYAVMMDREDTDWGTGSYDIAEAKAKARKYRAADCPDAFIAVIEISEHDSLCVDEIHDIDE